VILVKGYLILLGSLLKEGELAKDDSSLEILQVEGSKQK